MILTVLDRIPQRGGVLFGEAHDLFCVAVSNEVGLVGGIVPVVSLGLLCRPAANQKPWLEKSQGLETGCLFPLLAHGCRLTSLTPLRKVSPMSHSSPSPTSNLQGT